MAMTRKVKLQLVGLDGNAFSLMGAFQKQAQKEGWSKDEIHSVLDECRSSDYNHLLATLSDHCDDPSDGNDWDDDDGDDPWDDEDEADWDDEDPDGPFDPIGEDWEEDDPDETDAERADEYRDARRNRGGE